MNPTPTLEVLSAPAEYAGLPGRDLSGTVCVVFDILRATTTMLTALANGASAIVPVAEIADALAWRQRQPDVLLAGEREGVRIRAAQTGGVDFDLGNSPREFTAARVAGRTIVTTTTNGTRALRACVSAERVLIGSFLNLGALARWIVRTRPAHLLLVGAGTHDEAALEDTLAAGALCDRVWTAYADGHMSDAAVMARQLFQSAQGDLLGALSRGRNGRRLLQLPELAADVPWCVQLDTQNFLGSLSRDGRVVRLAD